jgi:hypothetical protein
LNWRRKKCGTIYKELIELLLKKLLSSQNNRFGIRDPGSAIRDPGKPILDPGSRGKKGSGSQIRIRNTAA